MNGLALCAGIGGLELGLSLALGPTYRTVCWVEREAPAAALLVAAMAHGILDEAPVWSDIATFDGRRWRGCVDLVSAGYPCQPFSVAGKRRGEADERHLWPHVARVVSEVEPVLVFLENVPGHLRLGFERVVADLRGMGYEVAAGLFTAEEVGAPHRRERLFILAEREQPRRPPSGERRDEHAGAEPQAGGGSVGHAILPRADADTAGCRSWGAVGESGRCVGYSAQPLIRQEPSAGAGLLGGAGTGSVGDPDAAGLEGRRLPGGECAGELPSWPPGPRGDWSGTDPRLWPATAQPAVRGVADGPPARIDLLRALGNAVVPVVAAHAFRTLAGVLRGEA